MQTLLPNAPHLEEECTVEFTNINAFHLTHLDNPADVPDPFITFVSPQILVEKRKTSVVRKVTSLSMARKSLIALLVDYQPCVVE